MSAKLIKLILQNTLLDKKIIKNLKIKLRLSIYMFRTEKP
jgi:hypothetical protein